MVAKVKIRILGRANSFNVRKVLWVCDELGLAFTREDWGRGYQPTSQPEFLAVNPIGLVPAVVLDDGTGLGDGTGAVSLRESNTIVRYLASRYGSDSLYPADLLRRARVEQWMDWANYETSVSLRGAFLGGQLGEPPWNNDWFIAQGRADLTRQLGQLDAHLRATGPYVTGADFTVGDIPIGLLVHRWFRLRFERPDLPAVAAYYQTLSRRPGYLTHVRNAYP